MQFNVKKLFSKKENKKIIIIVGLGNPGEKYKNTYHNVGYMVIDTLGSILNVKVKRAECHSLTGVYSTDSHRVILAKPITYMNLSGQAVKSLIVKHKADLEDIIIIFDDIDIYRFNIRARSSGSAGSHKGMRDIIDIIKSEQIKRIRVGVGREESQLKDYVLSDIKREDQQEFNKTFERVGNALQGYFEDEDFEKLMRTLNNKVGDEV